MDPASIKITAEPIDGSRCKFVASQPVHAAGVRRFASAPEAEGSPLPAAIFAIPGAEGGEGIVSGNPVTGGKRGAPPRAAVGESVGHAVPAPPVPAVRGIVDITDHTAGTNPYFAAAKK